MKKTIVVGALLVIIIMTIAVQKHDRSDFHSGTQPHMDKKATDKKHNDRSNKQDTVIAHLYTQKHQYKEIFYPTPNIDTSRINTVEGVILHHTAEPTNEKSLGVLTSLKKKSWNSLCH